MKTKFMPLSKEQVKQLPQEVQDKIANTLKAYNEVNITYEYGKYNVSTCIFICANYAPDHKFIGVVYADDFYTLEERIKNYEEEFKETAWWLRQKLNNEKGVKVNAQ